MIDVSFILCLYYIWRFKLNRPVKYLSIFFSLSGCASTIERSDYNLQPNKSYANIELIAVDKYRKTEGVTLSLLTHKSCSEKPNLARVVNIGHPGLLRPPTYKANAQLAAGESINIFIENRSMTGSLTTSGTACSLSKSLTLIAQKKYQIKVNNWSTTPSRFDGFGCSFDVVEVDETGQTLAILDLGKPVLPNCEAK
jgi:hypothetical protein